MPKQAKDLPGEEQSPEHGTSETEQQAHLDELKKQYATLHALLAKLEDRIAKLENPAHVERTVVKHLKRNLGISGLPARGDQA